MKRGKGSQNVEGALVFSASMPNPTRKPIEYRKEKIIQGEMTRTTKQKCKEELNKKINDKNNLK